MQQSKVFIESDLIFELTGTLMKGLKYMICNLILKILDHPSCE